MPGMTYQYDEKTHMVSNLYQIEILNKSKGKQHYKITVAPPLTLIWVGKGISMIENGKMAKGEFFIKGLVGQQPRREKLPIMVTDSEGDTEIIKTSFIQPDE
jgi:hypothetical protein